MKKLLPIFLLVLFAQACGRESDEDGSSLLDMFGREEETAPADAGVMEEVPYSKGPSAIPDDLVLPE